MKKIAIIGGGVALLIGLLSVGGATSSYVKTAWRQASEQLSELESTEFMIERLETTIQDLDPAIHTVEHQIAKEEVQVEQLQERLGGMQERLAKAKTDMLRLTEDLKRSDEVYVYVGKSYARSQVEEDLERRFDLFKSQETTAEQLREIVKARETSLDAARKKLGAMESQKKQLEVDLEQVKARLETLKAKQNASEIAVDDSALSRAKELRDQIEARLRLGEKMVESEQKIEGEIQLEEEAPKGDIVEQVTRHFDKNAPEGVVIQLD
jgi:DNA repair exonuclease SbcCD ATPase subunit